jgi:hypothetical protein
MHLAWLYLLHAEFTRDRIDFRYWDDRARPRRIHRVDGEPKTWELARCVIARWPNEREPVRRNLEFFIGLRNKIEHRYQEQIGIAVAGHAQALIVNFETELATQFGSGEGLANRLRFPVFLSSLTSDGVDALKRLRAKMPANATRYINDFHETLDDAVAIDPRFEFRVHLIPQLGPKSQADMAVRFVSVAELSEAEQEVLAKLGKSGLVATRTTRQPVQNLGRYRPTQAVRLIAAKVPGFTIGDFIWFWKHHRVRPVAGAGDPEKTDARYCVWDQPHGDYLYTDAWVNKLIRESNRS